MKKLIAFLGIFLLISFVFIGFSQSYAAQAPTSWPKEIVFGGGPSPATVSYAITAYWSNLLQKEYGIRATPVTSTSEEDALGAGKMEMAAGQIVGPVPEQAIKGEGPFAKAGPQPIRLLLNFSDIAWYFVTLKGSGINSLGDLKGKKFSGDSKGAEYVTWVNLELLHAYGLSEKDVSIGAFARQNEACTNVQSRVADVGGFVGPIPVGFVREFATTQDVTFLPLSAQAIKRVTDKWTWVAPAKIPANTYRGQTEDVTTVKSWLGFVSHKDLPDDFVYQLLKYAYGPDYRADFEKISVVIGKQTTLKRAVANATIPFHAGAVKFYKEAGVWTQELEKWQTDQLKKLNATR
jgi:TRAP transporter TAXI family solute receptor